MFSSEFDTLMFVCKLHFCDIQFKKIILCHELFSFICSKDGEDFYIDPELFNMDSLSCIESLRQQCLKKGLGGIKGLAVLFRGLDKDYSKTISLPEFRQGLKKYGLNVQEDNLVKLFKYFDKDNSGNIDFKEFIMLLRPPMPKARVAVINEAFDKLDAVKDGMLKVEDLKSKKFILINIFYYLLSTGTLLCLKVDLGDECH